MSPYGKHDFNPVEHGEAPVLGAIRYKAPDMRCGGEIQAISMRHCENLNPASETGYTLKRRRFDAVSRPTRSWTRTDRLSGIDARGLSQERTLLYAGVTDCGEPRASLLGQRVITRYILGQTP